MLHLYGAIHVSYVSVLVTLGAVIAHLYIYAPPRCRQNLSVQQDFYSFVSISVEQF